MNTRGRVWLFLVVVTVSFMALIALGGCTQRTILEIESCQWHVTEDRPAVITLADIERCAGHVEVLI